MRFECEDLWGVVQGGFVGWQCGWSSRAACAVGFWCERDACNGVLEWCCPSQNRVVGALGPLVQWGFFKWCSPSYSCVLVRHSSSCNGVFAWCSPLSDGVFMGCNPSCNGVDAVGLLRQWGFSCTVQPPVQWDFHVTEPSHIQWGFPVVSSLCNGVIGAIGLPCNGDIFMGQACVRWGFHVT